MVERIARVARVKGIEPEIGRSFERKEGFDDAKRQKKKFEEALSSAMERDVRPSNEAGDGVPNAYRLELSTRPTQSLFYSGGVDLSYLSHR